MPAHTPLSATRARGRGRFGRALVAAAVAAALAGPAAVPLAHADPSVNDATAVIMGDSFIAGEGGSWNGNPSPYPTNQGSPATFANLEFVVRGSTPAIYGSTLDDPTLPAGNGTGCHRSDPSEANPSDTGVNATIWFNIACSGASTPDIITTSFKGELSQTQQLDQIATEHNVKVIVLSIGGNDLGFAKAVSDCVQANFFGQPNCNPTEQRYVTGQLPVAMAGVAGAIQSIRDVMTHDGYGVSDYRLILQSYPAPLPPSSAMVDPSKRGLFNCPIYSADADWTNTWLIPNISTALEHVAHSAGVEFVDMQDLFRGHELCRVNGTGFPANTGSPARGGVAPFGTSGMSQMEWVHMVTPTQPVASWPAYNQPESMHPNGFGHQAMASCIGQVFNQLRVGEWSCRNDLASNSLVVSQTYSAPVPAPLASLNATSLTFGNLPLHGPSAVQTVAVTNVSGNPLTISFSQPAGDFRASGCSNTTLSAGQSCTLQLAFTPTAVGTHPAILNIVPAQQVSGNWVPGPRQTVSLTGNGIAASLSANSLQFGAVSVGRTVSQAVTATNQSAVPVTVSSTLLNDPSGSFSVVADGCSGRTLGPGQSCAASVAFQALSRGSVTAQLLINDDGAPAQQSVSLSGSGTCSGRLCS